MKKIKKIICLLAVVLLASCSKDSATDSGASSGTTPVAPSVDANAPVSGQFQKRVLIEDYTGTWCGYCPRIAYGIEQVNKRTDKVVSVAIHAASSPSGYEPFQASEAIVLLQNFSVSGFPTGKLNRATTWNAPESSYISQPVNLVSNNCGLGLALTSTVSSGTINLDVNMKFASDYTDLKLVVYVLEDGLIYNQTNYTAFYGGTATISNFKYNDVLREVLTDPMGDAISDATTTGLTVTKSFSVPVPANVANAANIKFVAFLVGSDNEAINVRGSLPGETQTFEVNP